MCSVVSFCLRRVLRFPLAPMPGEDAVGFQSVGYAYHLLAAGIFLEYTSHNRAFHVMYDGRAVYVDGMAVLCDAGYLACRCPTHRSELGALRTAVPFLIRHRKHNAECTVR